MCSGKLSRLAQDWFGTPGRYGEILFQKVASGYLLHFVQDGSSKHALENLFLRNNVTHLKIGEKIPINPPSLPLEGPYLPLRRALFAPAAAMLCLHAPLTEGVLEQSGACALQSRQHRRQSREALRQGGMLGEEARGGRQESDGGLARGA